ncbi:MAG: hypothetical protein H7A34_08750 [bacterium]|nr:hypothetical protein [bacterium]
MDYKTGVEKFVDHLMQIYDDSIRSSNPSWHAGRNMFGNRYEYESEDISGFDPRLTDHKQNAAVTRHVLGHAGVILAGRGMDDTFNVIPTKKGVGELTGYAISGIAQIADIWQKYFGDEEHRQGQADVEILNDYVARDIANAFTRAYEGKYTRDQLRQKIIHLLGQ